MDKLVEACLPAPHGKGDKTVYDDSYRLAKEMVSKNYSISQNLLEDNDVISAIKMVTNSTRIAARPYKLNAYTEGGFFKAHCDTPKDTKQSALC